MEYEDAIEDPREVTDAEMDRIMHSGDEGLEEPVTFRQRLEIEIARGGHFPCLFASTEY
jgi:hypothetical protein